MSNLNKVKPSFMIKPITGCRLIMIFILLIFVFLSCSEDKSVQSGKSSDFQAKINPQTAGLDEREFVLIPKYSSIRSYPGGGGIFIVKLLTSDNTPGDFILSLRADTLLNARLDRYVLNNRANIAEITIRPSESIEIGIYEIELRAVHAVSPSNVVRYHSILLEVDLLQWGPGNVDDAVIKRDEFIGWLQAEHPELGNFSNRIWFPYMTYPQIWIVEHWTFLDEDWEFRLCYHVMIPPYDWSKILLRRRGKWNPVLAAMRETDGTIHEIPISEYPIMFGY